MNNIVSLDEDQLETFCNNFFWDWKNAYPDQNYILCRKLVIDFINVLKPIYTGKSYGPNSDSYTYIYVFLMLAKGLGDVIDLAEQTKNKNWSDHEKLTEAVWLKLWDAKERLGYFNSHCLAPEILTGLCDQLDELEYYFYDLFGRGIYASPEILIKRAECSICQKNIKSCMHIPGDIYNGVPCRENVVDMELLNVSLLQSPYDMRCRVWPWNVTKDMKVTVRIMNIEPIDSFIFDAN